MKMQKSVGTSVSQIKNFPSILKKISSITSALIQLTNTNYSKALVTIAQRGNNLEKKCKNSIFSTITFKDYNRKDDDKAPAFKAFMCLGSEFFTLFYDKLRYFF